VSHVHHHEGTDLVADGSEARIVPVTGISRASANNELGLEKHGLLFELVVVNVAGGLVQAVRKRLEVDGGSRDPLLGSVEPVGQVATVRQVKAHDTVVGLEERSVHGEVGGRARVRLNVYAPLLLIQVERSESTILAEALDLVHVLVSTIVPCAGLAL